MTELLAMTLWFSVSAVGPELADAWGLSAAETAWLTSAVHLGFVFDASPVVVVPFVLVWGFPSSPTGLAGGRGSQWSTAGSISPMPPVR